MGIVLTKYLEEWYTSFFKPTQILILGLDNAGKTQILYCMKLGQAITNTIPTMGFNVEEIKYKNLTINAFDLGGQNKFRSMWTHYYEGTDAVIFVVDSHDRGRFKDVKAELHAAMENDYLKNTPFLIFANKQDLPHAAEVTELKKTLCISEDGLRDVRIIACSAINNEKIELGLKWLSNIL